MAGQATLAFSSDAQCDGLYVLSVKIVPGLSNVFFRNISDLWH